MMKKPGSGLLSILIAFFMLLGAVPLGSAAAFADDQMTAAVTFSDAQFRKVKSKKIKGRDLCVNLRTLLGEKAGQGYSVVQGGCTDGTYVYYMMVSTSNQKGRVLKVRLKDHSVVKRGPVVDIHHGNGMAYDSKRHRLVVVGRERRRCELVTIDAKTLRLRSKKKINYAAAKEWGVRTGDFYYGVSSISYIPKYDCYVALQRNTHDLLVLDPDFKVIGMAKTKIPERYSGLYQAMDADEKYVYLVMSGSRENLILVIDWNSENLLPYVNGKVPAIAKPWKCNNSKNGREDAVIRIGTGNEAENLYHTTDKSGKEHFYMAEYCPYSTYRYVTGKVKKKVKWKQVKVNGRYVWKYRTKYVSKKVKQKIKKAYRRDNYVYDLGII